MFIAFIIGPGLGPLGANASIGDVGLKLKFELRLGLGLGFEFGLGKGKGGIWLSLGPIMGLLILITTIL